LPLTPRTFPIPQTPTVAGEIARRHIRDPELLRFLDMECFTYSTVRADLTPMVTSGMVMSDR
jgi:prolycopene isomerase